MNQINYNQTGGFPLDTNILDFGQKANQITQELGGIINPLAIIKGCETNGTYVGDGIVFIHGEILPFRGGTNTGRVIIQEEYEGRQFEGKPTLDNVLVTRTACFGETVSVAYQWSNFYRPTTIKQLEETKAEKNIVQQLVEDVERLKIFARPFQHGGGAVLWLKPFNEIPTGWREVESLRGRFPLGFNPNDYDFNQIGVNGGSKHINILEKHLPKIRLKWKFKKGVMNDTFNGRDSAVYCADPDKLKKNAIDIDQYPLEEFGGGSQDLHSMNPYRIVVYIEPLPQ